MTDLAELLHDRLDRVDVPVPDLAGVERRGHRIRRTRTVAAAGALAAGVVAVGLVSSQLTGGASPDSSGRGVEPLGAMDFDAGLRAYAAPGAEIHLGGRAFPASELQGLDTDAAATPYGVVYYDGGRPMLLQESGRSRPLERDAEAAAGPGATFQPTAKADARAPLVAYGAVLDGRPTVVVRNLATGREVGRRPVSRGTVIDALDRGVVFLRTDAGTTTWDTATDAVRELAGPRTRVAAVRAGVVLYDGPPPAGPAASAYRLVAGAVDAQLTFDGRHVLYWSSRLESTDGGAPVVLDEGDASKGPASGWWTFDTDGSVLTAVPGGGQTSEVYDCEVPSGTCTDLGPLVTEHGDPMFIGDDM